MGNVKLMIMYQIFECANYNRDKVKGVFLHPALRSLRHEKLRKCL